MCVRQGCQPSEFWAMTPAEVWVYLEAFKQPVQNGSLREQELDYLLEIHEDGDYL